MGCTIFVKLWQFDPDDRTQVRIDTRKMVFAATPGRPGAEIMPLFRDDHEDVRLERWAPGAKITLGDPSGIEVIVLDGGFSTGGEVFEPQSWLRLPPGETITVKAALNGTKVWVKSGHLTRAQTIPHAAA